MIVLAISDFMNLKLRRELEQCSTFGGDPRFHLIQSYPYPFFHMR